MSKPTQTYFIHPNQRPKVLLLGNGMLRLGNEAAGWDDLLVKIKTRPGKLDVKGANVPYAMQPEALCGVDVEQIQRDVSANIVTLKKHHPLLDELLGLPFDAVLTTNYTYEAEAILSGKEWPGKSERRKAFTVLDNKPTVRHNTFICNSVKVPGRGVIPVFHIHGEAERKHSLILSYYSYANALSRLVTYNRDKLKDSLNEHQQEQKDYQCRCWLDYFIMGDVWSVGFGLDVSEFDVWWAIERKAREKAEHGRFKAYFEKKPDAKTDTAQVLLLGAMDADYKSIPLTGDKYEALYREVIDDIKKDMKL